VTRDAFFIDNKIEMLFHHLIEYSEPQMSEQQEQQNLNEFAKMLADGKITPEQACSLIEELRDADQCHEEIDAQNEQQKCFNEIAWVFADWKITTEEACDLFKEWLDEWIDAGKAE
jgi:hypothetical protein